MKQDATTVCSNLSELSRDEKREIWVKRNGLTLKTLAEVAGVTVSTFSRTLRNPTMPVEQHRSLVDFGVPADLLPDPVDQKPGPKPRLLEPTNA